MSVVHPKPWQLPEYGQINQTVHYRLHLYGAMESGKSTILKQMRMLYGSNFSEQEKYKIKKDIKGYVHDAILTITYKMSTSTPSLAVENFKIHAKMDYLQTLASMCAFDFSPEFFDYAQSVWEDGGVKATFQQMEKGQFLTNAQHFLDQLDTIRQTDYNPSQEDILRCPVMSGFSQVRFQMDEFTFDLCKFPRNNARRFYMDVTAIVFVTACNLYDTPCDNTSSRTDLQESLHLFKQLWKCFCQRHKIPVILFLNKQDLLAEKILEGRSKLEDYFPEFACYQTPPNEKIGSREHPEVARAKYFIRDEFLKTCSTGQDKFCFCYPHFTCAIDSESIKEIFDDCCDVIWYSNLCRFNRF